MEKFSQKWAVIVPFEPVQDGVEFSFDAFPLHMTLAGVFAHDLDGQTLRKKLSELLANHRQFTVTADTEQWFGPEQNIGVMTIVKSPDVQELYDRVHQFLLTSGAVFNEPHYEGDGYVPHATHQRHARLSAGDIVTVKAVSLVDLFPGGNGYKRTIVQTFSLLPEPLAVL